MPKADLLSHSVPRAELDERARDSRFRLELILIEQFLASRRAAGLLGRWFRLFRTGLVLAARPRHGRHARRRQGAGTPAGAPPLGGFGFVVVPVRCAANAAVRRTAAF